MKYILKRTKERRENWVKKIGIGEKDFSNVAISFQKELDTEWKNEGIDAILDHLRCCGHIPEKYDHDSTEEKLYSKYTDSVISQTFRVLGLNSRVLTERSDAADVEVRASKFSFVADAKAFRLSRTAKNQKDFKVQAMDGWRGKNDFAIIVCPIYQLPKRESQIYQQAITRNVCIFTYSHLCLLLRIALSESNEIAISQLEKIFHGITSLSISKSAETYWSFINKTLRSYSKKIEEIFHSESQAELEALNFAKEEGFNFYLNEVKRIEALDHKSVVNELKSKYNFENKLNTIDLISDNGLFNV